MKIPITKPSFGDEERRAILEPLESGWVVQGPKVSQFERDFTAFTGVPHAVATSSCTTALHIAVAALGLKPGDEVIVPAFTWIATANVVEYMGATPVFCDIDLATFNIDPERIGDFVTPKTVGIIPVHLFGLCADMDPIQRLADKHGLWIVEDAACGFGARYRGRHAGVFGRMGCFSFHPRKAITTGEGGMVTTADTGLAELSRSLRDHGASRSDLARHTSAGGFLLPEYNHLGFNYRMTDIQAALGVVQLTRAGEILERRRAIGHRYDDLLRPLEWLERPVVPEGYDHGYQSYVTLFRPETPTVKNVGKLYETRNSLMQRMEARGIATRQGTHAPVMLGYYESKYRLRPEAFPNALIADRLSLSLPIYPDMTTEEQDFVVRGLSEEMAQVR